MRYLSQRRFCDKYRIDATGMTYDEATQAINDYAKANSRRSRPYDAATATPAEVDAHLTAIFGPA
jgi:hypothetical protein